MSSLQPFGFKESRYERPNQNWVCGWAAEGRVCPLGPDAHGHCRTTSECAPVRKGDRWFCTRPASAGGACLEGPKPDGRCSRPMVRCVPLRSLRARRGLVTRWTVGLTFGTLLILLGGGSRWQFASPGSLSSPHALSSCSDCHHLPAAAQNFSSAFKPPHAYQDSQLCLNCHPLGADPFQPHGLSGAEPIPPFLLSPWPLVHRCLVCRATVCRALPVITNIWARRKSSPG